METITSKQKPMLVAAPIYRFLDLPEEKGRWGWQRAKDLVEAVNSALALSKIGKRKPMDTLAIAREYPLVNPASTEDCEEPVSFFMLDDKQGLYLVDVRDHNKDTWFDDLVKDNCYLPARIGMRILEAVRRGPIFGDNEQEEKEVQKISMA